MTRREFIASWFGAAWGFAVGTILGRNVWLESGFGPHADVRLQVPVTPVQREAGPEVAFEDFDPERFEAMLREGEPFERALREWRHSESMKDLAMLRAAKTRL